ncbi:acetyl-CoA C-acyltransferase [Anaeromyxobacter diazotrophicus]|uniref:Acetyl-CoA acetyltransferase n=1 Tax=Anaeromyxobacter diazotrophicus TaxID=2590199 RepID=A0A7I9VN44_9BACT|nr:acetyl-CoA C-acyltransferase [Anaeromyxobacter diazotrophicus]GEJ57825.1 acetyl-CoA acetyltransferase [Anaeromyxobacter diazotrophicus]
MRAATPHDVVFLAARRTPFGTYGGSLKDLSATDLGVHAAQAALAQAGVSPERVDHVVFGNVAQTSSDAIYLARHVGLRAGAPVSTPALTVNRLCGSGFEAVVQGARLLAGGEAELVLAGGTESMSQAPLVLRGTRWGFPLGKPPPLEDMLWSALTDSWAGMPMALTAEKLAEQYRIGQDEVDAYSVLSQRRFAAAQEAGRLAEELAPIELPTRKGPVKFARDEHPRPDTTVESLRKLPKVFKKDGVIHAGAASGVSDGAGALLLSTRAFADAHGIRPLGRLLNWGFAGVDPTIMGIGPVAAFKNALERAQAKLSDFDLFEVNEAFAPQYLAVEQELGLPRDQTNVDGGAIAVGHPLAASGARITMHLLYELRRRGARYGLGGACIGGGQGIAVIVEAL